MHCIEWRSLQVVGIQNFARCFLYGRVHLVRRHLHSTTAVKLRTCRSTRMTRVSIWLADSVIHYYELITVDVNLCFSFVFFICLPHCPEGFGKPKVWMLWICDCHSKFQRFAFRASFRRGNLDSVELSQIKRMYSTKCSKILELQKLAGLAVIRAEGS